MKTKLLCAGTACALTLASPALRAEGNVGLSHEIELEIGVTTVFDSDVPADEVTDVYGAASLGLEFALSDRVTAFAGLTFESVLDPAGDRVFKDMGLYVAELGLAFDLGVAQVAAGKISPAFGIAWDQTPSFFGTSYAEDYELAEMIGARADIALGQGTLSAAVFFADTTPLSESFGTNRGRASTSDGGAGNTGTLNNFALHYDVAFGETTLSAGARFLSAGTGDVSDEKGLSLGVAHAVNDAVSVLAEVAAFDGYGGSSDTATYATIGASYARGPITYNAAYTRRDITSSGVDHLVSVGIDYELTNGITLTGGYGFANEGGPKSHMLGLAFVIPISG